MASDPPGPYSIGSDTWPGLSRLAADAAQVVRVACAIIGTGNDTQDDEGGLRESLQEELGDLRAAIDYVIGKNALDWTEVNKRRDRRRSLYERGIDDLRTHPHQHPQPQPGQHQHPQPQPVQAQPVQAQPGQHQPGQHQPGQHQHSPDQHSPDLRGADPRGQDTPGGRPASHQHARSPRPGPPRSSRRAPRARASVPGSPAASD